MVARSDEHDDDCPRCRFRLALASHLTDLAAAREAAWHDATGSIVSATSTVTSALALMRAMRFAGHPDETAAAASKAAHALMVIADTVEELHELLDDEWADDDEDDD